MKATALVACLLSLAVMLGWAAPTQAAYEFNMGIHGAKQGWFKPENATKGGLPCLGFQLAAESLRDAQSGLPTGRRQYSPLTVTRAWGPSSPQIFEAFATDEPLPEVTFDFPVVGPNGTASVAYTIKLTNATIIGVTYHLEPAVQPPALQRLLEDVSFSFQKIQVTTVNGGVTAEDTLGGSATLAPGHLFLPGTLPR